MKHFADTYLRSAVRRAARKGRIPADRVDRLCRSLHDRRNAAYKANNWRAHFFLVMDVVRGMRLDGDIATAKLLLGNA